MSLLNNRNTGSWSLSSRNEASMTKPNKNSGSYSLGSRNESSMTKQLRHGRDVVLDDMDHLTFEDPLFPGGDPIKDLTFEGIGQNKTWNLQTKN